MHCILATNKIKNNNNNLGVEYVGKNILLNSETHNIFPLSSLLFAIILQIQDTREEKGIKKLKLKMESKIIIICRWYCYFTRKPNRGNLKLLQTIEFKKIVV